MNPTTSSTIALLVVRTLESYQCDGRSVVRQAGLDPAKLTDPNARFPVEAMQRLWRLAVEASGDPAFGLDTARHLHPTTLHALGYSWMASANLRDALERMTRYADIVSTAVALRLEEADTYFDFRMGVKPGLTEPLGASADAALALVVQLCRTAYGPDFNPLRVTMSREQPEDDGPYQRFFGVPIEFSAPDNVLYFSKDELEAHLPTANPDLVHANDEVVKAYLARFVPSSTAMRVRAKIIEKLPSGRVSQESVARALHMSTRSLQRKLEAESASYRALLDETRREVASRYMEQSNLSVSEITYLLGFSEPSNFTRAFKRWTGSSPTGYRERSER